MYDPESGTEPTDPFDLAYEQWFGILTADWQRFSFRNMTKAELDASAVIVTAGYAELRIDCRLDGVVDDNSMRALLAVSGDYTGQQRNGNLVEHELRKLTQVIPSWREPNCRVRMAMHKCAKRLTTQGLRVIEAYRAGIRRSLWEPFPMRVPGKIVVERFKAVPGPARASVPTVATHVTVQSQQCTIQATTVNVNDQLSTPEIVQEDENDAPLLTVERWSDLGLGIDENRVVWALSPAPGIGETFAKARAIELKSFGRQWMAVMEAFANSQDGCRVERSTLIRAFQLLPPGSSAESDPRARPGAIRREQTADMHTQGSIVRRNLSNTLADLRRKLQRRISGPKGKSAACLRMDGKWVHSGFLVRYLLRNPDRTFSYGESSRP